jgi:hypothetical protein
MKHATVPAWLLHLTGTWSADFNIRIVHLAEERGIPLDRESEALKALIAEQKAKQ